MYVNKILHNRNALFFSLVCYGLASLLMFNLFRLQVIQGKDLYIISKNVYSNLNIDRAVRGVIYDRNGVKLVDNVPKFKLYINKDFKDQKILDLTLENLKQLFQVDVKSIYEKELEKISGYPNIREIKLFSNLDYNPYIFQIEANPQKYPLVKIEKYLQRKYLYPHITSHILGYVGEISDEEYMSGKYDYGDIVGKDGIERGFDTILRGKNGLQRIDFYDNGDKRIVTNLRPRVNGADLYLTIDIQIQQKLYELIERALQKPEFATTQSFGVVVEDVTNGEILALASYPSFDSNKFVEGISDEDYKKYLDNPGKPLINKVTQYAQPPGSTFKVLTQLTALKHNFATKDTTYYTGGVFNYGGVDFVDINRINFGTINMTQALCVSSNIYHMKLALDMDTKTQGQGATLIYELFDEIGLNASSGINIGTETIGYFPTPQTKQARGGIWYTGDLLNASIGQGDVKLTPIASAKMVSTIASGGKVIPQTIILDENRRNINFTDLNIDKEAFSTIRAGMECAANATNTVIGIKSNDYPKVASKTGSAETGKYQDNKPLVHGWEISFSPSDDPKIAMSIFMENSGAGWKGAFISRELHKFIADMKR
ncbi:MAG: penicillin-binding protein 2 [Candidatus Dojkabacteria bacterium]|nr:MAG: penicillin-binding protein 2 [Candidatus Dojkabacteria bacterium]